VVEFLATDLSDYVTGAEIRIAGDWCCRWVSNLRPLPYQGSALPLSYGSIPARRMIQGTTGRQYTSFRRLSRCPNEGSPSSNLDNYYIDITYGGDETTR
jgi:hypothetical protein